MKSNQKILIIALAMLAGVIGGFISNQIFQTKSAFAENEQKPRKVVIAEEFRLVDKDGNIVGNLSSYTQYFGNRKYSASDFNLSCSKSKSEFRVITGLFGSVLSLKGHSTNALTFVTTQGKTYLALLDKDENERIIIGNKETISTKTGVTHKHPRPSIILLDEKGNVLWSAP